jgi:hypothetical protein
MTLRRLHTSALALVLGPLALFAAGSAAGASPEIDAVLACRTITDDAAQLACFRRAADALAAPSADTEAAARAPATPTPFGARPPRPARPPKSAQLRQITLKLVSLSDPGDGHAVLVFSDGSVWREIDAAPLAGSLQPGQTVQIEKGALGSFLLDVPHAAAVHVRRLKG